MLSFVIVRPLAGTLDVWSQWSFVAVLLSGLYAIYLVRTVYRDPAWEEPYKEFSRDRTFMMELMVVLWFFTPFTFFGAIWSLFSFREIPLGIITIKIVGGYIPRSELWHVFFVFLVVLVLSSGEVLMMRKIKQTNNERFKNRLRQILQYVNLPAVTGFGALFLFLVSLDGDAAQSSRIFASGAIAFELLALNLTYAIIGRNPLDPPNVS